MPERSLTIVDAGALTTIQDRGRQGWAHLGVPRSGAADIDAHDLANRLVGNPGDAAGLEATLTGCTFRVAAATRMAVTGARCAVTINRRAVSWGSEVSVPAGATVKVGPADRGLRSYVGIAGGITVEPVLGSRATDTLSGLGPPQLAAGDVLTVGTPPAPAPWVEDVTGLSDDVVAVVVPGPHAHWFSSLSAIEQTFTVGAASNRVGVRLEGVPLTRAPAWAGTELESQPMVLGAVQVPPSGQPVVLMADHATTGGYPVIGVVRSVSRLAQVRPGQGVTLRLAR